MEPTAHPKAPGAATSSGKPGASRLPTDLASVLRRLDADLAALYGERYGGLVLYGSYARGEADEGSDVDLLLLLGGGEVDQTREVLRAEEVKWPLSLESSYVLSLLPVSVDAYRSSEDPFLWNARREGIPAA
jgi:predicted nucleotidyltransferase